MTIRIGIAGIAGRMGRLLAEETVAAGATLAGGTLRPGASLDTLPPGLPVVTDIVALCAASDVVIDFTHAHAARDPPADVAQKPGAGARRLADDRVAPRLAAAGIGEWRH